jgi:hypothetical protein
MVPGSSERRPRCPDLDSSSRAHGTFNLSRAAGAWYRIQVKYIHSSKDISNLSNHSGWLYFEVVK